MVLPLAGCAKDACTEHVDENKDAVCDKCTAALTCETHVDADANLACDVCGASVTSACELHVDDDENLSCDVCGATLTAPCDPHKDTNADGLCDVCKGAIVVINQPIAPKEEVRVDMVVNTVPTGVELGDYIHTDLVEEKAPTAATALKAGVLYDRYYYTVEKDKTSGLSTHMLTNLVSGERIYERKETTVGEVQLTMMDCFFRVSVTENDSVKDSYYAYSDTFVSAPFATETIAVSKLGTAHRGFDETALTGGNRLFTMKDSCYVFNGTELLFGPMEKNTFVDRPAFDSGKVGEKYGYVQYGGRIYAYDLSEWLSCAYSYSIPSYYERVSTFLLENGNLLLQAFVKLPDGAVSYDCLEGSQKYDLVWVILNPEKKQASEVEFGYYIAAILSPDKTFFTDRAPNRLRAYRIVNDRIDTNAPKDFLVDNSLKILYDCASALKEWDGSLGVWMVADNRYMVETALDGSSTLKRIFDEKGELVCYLPTGAVCYDSYVVCGDKFYSYDMELLLDSSAEKYTVERICSTYSIFGRVNGEGKTEWYYYNGEGAPKLLETKDGTPSYINEEGFIVYLDKTSGGSRTFFCDYYDREGNLITAMTALYSEKIVLDAETGCYLLKDTADNCYLVK